MQERYWKATARNIAAESHFPTTERTVPSRVRQSSLSLLGPNDDSISHCAEVGPPHLFDCESIATAASSNLAEIDSLWQDLGDVSPATGADSGEIVLGLDSDPLFSSNFEAELDDFSLGADLLKSPVTPTTAVASAVKFERQNSLELRLASALNSSPATMAPGSRLSCGSSASTDSSNSVFSSDDGSSDTDESGKPRNGGDRDPKPCLPAITTVRSMKIITDNLQAYLKAHAWDELKQQLKASARYLPPKDAAEWKNKRSKGMKLARNRRYGSRRRARERREAKELEVRVKQLEQQKATLMLRISDFSHKKTKRDVVFRRPVRLTLDGFITPDRLSSLEEISVGNDSPPRKRMTYAKPKRSVFRGVDSIETPGSMKEPSFSGTGLRLFAVVALAVIATSIDGGFDSESINGTQNGNEGFTLSAFFLLSSKSVLAFAESSPVTTAAGIVLSTLLAVIFALVTGTQARQRITHPI